MKEINPNQVNKNSFQNGKIKKAAVEVRNMEDTIKNYVKILLDKAKDSRSLPPYGDFSPLYVQFANTNKELCATDFMLKISKPPKNIEGHEKIRNLEVVAYKLPAPYKSECIIATGSKEDIVKALENSEIIQKINNTAKSLSKDLDDI